MNLQTRAFRTGGGRASHRFVTCSSEVPHSFHVSHFTFHEWARGGAEPRRGARDGTPGASARVDRSGQPAGAARPRPARHTVTATDTDTVRDKATGGGRAVARLGGGRRTSSQPLSFHVSRKGGRAPPPRGPGRKYVPGARRAQAAEGTGAPDGPERRRAPRRPPGAEGPAPSMTCRPGEEGPRRTASWWRCARAAGGSDRPVVTEPPPEAKRRQGGGAAVPVESKGVRG